MRFGLYLLVVIALVRQDGTEPAKRYGHDVNEAGYPQKTPDIALASVLKAIGERRIDYLMAQLADPKFVDKKVAEYQSRFQGPEDARVLLGFDQLVKETARYYRDDPMLVNDLKRFAKDAEWKLDGNTAVGGVKALPGRQVFMRKVRERWFLENKQQ